MPSLESIARAVCSIHRIDRASLLGRDRMQAWARRQLIAAAHNSRSLHRTSTLLNTFFGHDNKYDPRFDRTAIAWHIEQHAHILRFALFDILPAKYRTASRFHTGRGASRYTARWYLLCEALELPYGSDIVDINFVRIATFIRQERESCSLTLTPSSSAQSASAKTSATSTNSRSQSACAD